MCRILMCFIGVLCSSVVFGQGKNNSLEGVPFKERIVFGGGLGGLSFGSYQDFISVSPLIGYRVTAKLIAGTGFTYRYTNYKEFSPSIKLNDYGINPFLRFTVYKNIFIQTEYEYLTYEYPVTRTTTSRRDFNSVLVGGGFAQPIGEKASLYIMALYNLSYKNPSVGNYSPYDSPLVIRAGITIGNFGF